MKKIPTLVLIIILSAYATTIFHELSHSLYAYIYGCKTTPLSIQITPYLAGSNDGEYIEGCWQSLNPTRQLEIARAGVLINLILGSIFFLLLYLIKNPQKSMLYSFLFVFSLFNFLAAFIYLTVGSFLHTNNPLIVEDVQTILAITGLNPLILFVPSAIIFAGIIYLYTKKLPSMLAIYFQVSNKQIKKIKLAFVCIIILFMLAVVVYKLLKLFG